ncbi:MAG: NAD-dependent epimerase/dehydratase family protein [Mangrovibacterium sp.]
MSPSRSTTKKILLTGATGLLGSNLLLALRAQGREVRCLLRPDSQSGLTKQSGAEIIRGNLLRTADVRKALKGCPVVIHAAAHTSQWPTGYVHYRPVNVEATRLLLRESLDAGVERFLLVGSANAFGPGSKIHPGNESFPFLPARYHSGYMRSKYEAQQLVLYFTRQYGFPALVVCPSFMLGAHDLKPSSGQILLMAWKKQLMACPPGGKNFVHVNDVVSGIIRALEAGETGQAYLLGHENLSYAEFFRKMKTVCGYPKRLLPIPRALICGAGHAGSLFELLSGKPAPLNRVNASLLATANYYSPAKAVEQLQLPQTPVEQAIADALNWFDRTGRLK